MKTSRRRGDRPDILRSAQDGRYALLIALVLGVILPAYCWWPHMPLALMVGNLFVELGAKDLLFLGSVVAGLGWSLAVIWTLSHRHRSKEGIYLPRTPMVSSRLVLFSGLLLPALDVLALATSYQPISTSWLSRDVLLRLLAGLAGIAMTWTVAEILSMGLAFLIPGVIVHELGPAAHFSRWRAQATKVGRLAIMHHALSRVLDEDLKLPNVYFVYAPGDPRRSLNLLHVYATLWTLVLALLFALGAWLWHPMTTKALDQLPWAGPLLWLATPPALGILLFFFLQLCWFLAAASFFLDQVRFSSFGLLLMLLAIANGLRLSENRVVIREGQPALPRLTTREVLAPAQDDRPLVVVAAYGGGIQASGWTATVLTGLAERIPTFSRDLRLVSGVSGGAVGAAYYLDGVLGKRARQDVMDASVASSLEALSYGLVFHDLPHLVFPFLGGADRGTLMEQAWLAAGAAKKDIPLRELGPLIRSGMIPALVFNTTIAETGEYLLISPLRLDFEPGSYVEDFFDRYQVQDLDLWKAARLSATFPFISPPAYLQRPGETQREHLVDGGYFDNLGMTTAMGFIRDVLAHHDPHHRRRVALVQVQSFTDLFPLEKQLGSSIISPMNALMNTRHTSQVTRAALTVDLLRQEFGTEHVQAFTFQPSNLVGSLSWHLSPSEITQLQADWQLPSVQAEVSRLQAFLEKPLP